MDACRANAQDRRNEYARHTICARRPNLSIIGMGFTAACAILLFIIPAWGWGLLMTLAFFPFLGLIILVEHYSAKHGLIGPEEPGTAPE